MAAITPLCRFLCLGASEDSGNDHIFTPMISNTWKSAGLGSALILLLTVVAYLPALRGGFIWDDDSYVTQNQVLRSNDGLWNIWTTPGVTPQYYPLVFTSFWVEHHLWKLQPFGYHLVNILLHALNAVLLWRVLQRLEIPGAWCAAAIFALHPVQVESVAWITERKNVLAGTFYFLALLAYFRFRPLTGERAASALDWRFYPLVIGLFLCALLSKTVTCSMPAVIVLLIWWKRERIEKWDFLPLLPLFILGAALGFLTTWIEKHHVGASGNDWTLTFVDRWLVAGRALWFYAGKLLWPHELTFIYPRWEIDAGAWWQYLFPLAALIVLIALGLLRRRIGMGPLAAVLFFAGTLSPALGFFDIYPFRYSFVADHFQYLACIGPIGLAVSAGAAIYTRSGTWGKGLGMLALGVVLTILGMSTWRQGSIYKDPETLWRDTLTKNPGAWMAHNNWASVLASQGKVEEAIAEYRASLRINANNAEAHNNLGIALVAQGKLAEATVEYQSALRITPDSAETHNNLGSVLAGQGRVAEAIAEYRAALGIEPDHAETHNNLGVALASQGQVAEAIAEYEAALRVKPDYAEAHYNRGVILASQGKAAEAIAEYSAALRVLPAYVEAHNNLGNALARQGRIAEAIGEYNAALRVRPDYTQAHYNLGNALAGQGRISEAIAEYRETLRLRPDWPPALRKLAWILATNGDAAIRNAAEAVSLAERLCTVMGSQQADALDVLAAAYAEDGRFPDAIRVAQKAVKLAKTTGHQELETQIQNELKLYQAGLPYHEASMPRAPGP